MPADPFFAEYQALESRLLQAMTPDLSEEEFSEAALAVHAFQRQWNRPLDAFAATRPVPRHWREIPAVPQQAFKRAVLSCVPPSLPTTVFRTSGTTGEVKGEHWFANTRLYDESILRGWDRLALPKATVFVLAPSASQAPHSSLSHMLDLLGRERSALPGRHFVELDGRLRVKELTAAIGEADHRGEPIALLGTALGFLNLCERLGSASLRLPPGSYAMETGGFKGSGRELTKVELYNGLARSLGLTVDDVINEYGMTELSSQFYTRGLERPHQGPPWLRALVIDPETGHETAPGEVGILRLFDLANLNSSLAIETRDLAIRREDGFELLGRDPAALPRGCSRAADELMRR